MWLKRLECVMRFLVLKGIVEKTGGQFVFVKGLGEPGQEHLRALASEFRVSGRQRGAGSICFEQKKMRHALMFNLEVISKKNQGIYTLCSGSSSRLHVGSCTKSWRIRLDRRMLVLFGRR